MYDFIREILTGNRPLIFDHQLKKCLVIRFYSDFFKRNTTWALLEDAFGMKRIAWEFFFRGSKEDASGRTPPRWTFSVYNFKYNEAERVLGEEEFANK